MRSKVAVISILLVALVGLGCLSVNFRRPATAEELRFSVNFTATVAHGLGYYWGWDRLEGKAETSGTAAEVLEVGEALATAGVTLSDITIVGQTEAGQPIYESLTADEYASLREAIRILSGEDWNSPDRRLVLSRAGLWLVAANINLSDRAHLAVFCTQAANGVRFAYKDRYLPQQIE